MDFKDKVVLVTGAASGIGEATALQFAQYGAKMSLVDINIEGLEKIRLACEEKGVEALIILANLSEDEGCEMAAKETIARFGRLDVLVNNAGILSSWANILNATMDDFDAVFKLNVRAVYNLTRLLAPELVKTKGNVVNLASIAAYNVNPYTAPYGMSKAAVDHFTRLAALELAPLGVRVNAVCPGVTISNIFRNKMKDLTEEKYKEFLDENLIPHIPMRKACVPDDIANVITFLASDKCGLVTGTSVKIDGGKTLYGPGTDKYMAENA